MSRQEMEKALATGFNKQGRTVSESMRLKYMTALSVEPKEFTAETYRGFEISGKPGKWFAGTFPVVFESRCKAMAAVDRCLALREELPN